jgi:aminoglycoside N3'-acetyltransferase
MHTRESLTADAVRLGIESGDTIFVHASFNRISREEVFVFWDQSNHQKRGKIGDADCRLFLIREFLDIMLDAIKADPKHFFKSYQD